MNETLNDKFRELIVKAMAEKNLNTNRLSVLAGIPRDPIYRYLAMSTVSIGSYALGRIFQVLDIKVG